MHQYDSDVISVMSRDTTACLPDIIKQESHLAKPCLDPLTASNGYGLSSGTRDTWPSFRDGFSFSSGADAKMVANMAAVTSSSSHVGQFGAVDWTTMGSRTAQTAAQQYYGTPLAQAAAYAGPTAHHPAHHPYAGWTDTSHGHAAQSAYAYGMTSPHNVFSNQLAATYRQSESSPTSGYPYSTFSTGSTLTPGSGLKEGMVTTPSIQDMDAERTIRRARRNRTCFSKHQMESLEEVFKESRYPDVYRREEIAATLDLKEEVVRVWFKNRRAKMKRENKDGKVTSPGSPTSTTPSPKSSTSPSFPTGSTLYSSGPGSYPAPTAFSAIPSLKPETSYFPTSYPSYTHPHSTVVAAAETGPSSSSPSLPKPPQLSALHVQTSRPPPNGHSMNHDVPTYSSSSRTDVTSTYNNSVKCEPTTSEHPSREYTTGSDLLTSAGSERSTPLMSKSHHHHTLSPTGTDQ